MPDLTLVPDPDHKHYRHALIEQLTRGIVQNLKDAARAAADGSLDTAEQSIAEARRLCRCALETKGCGA